MKIGFFYQAGHMDNNILSTYMALKQLRKIYPENSVAFYEDESNNLKKIAIEFNCDYKKIPESENLFAKRMPVVNLDTGLKWLNRVYEACNTTLKNAEWIMHFEDDVWIQKEIENFPKLDFAGSSGHGWSEELYGFLKNRFNIKDESRGHNSPLGQLSGYGMCGGSIFKKECFIQAYEKLNEIDWNYLEKLDFRVCKYTDAILGFLLAYHGFRYEIWPEWTQYNPGAESRCSVLHNVKHFYDYKSIEDLNSVLQKEEVKKFLTYYNGY